MAKKLPALKRLINKIEKTCPVRPATEEELAALQELAGGRLPEEVVEFYSKYNIDGRARIDGEIDFYGIDQIIKNNTDAVPGYMILPFGLLTLATWINGDAICLDLIGGRIHQCSHSLFSESEEICFYSGKLKQMIKLPFDRENVMALSPWVSIDFIYFVKHLRDGDLWYYDLPKIMHEYVDKHFDVKD